MSSDAGSIPAASIYCIKMIKKKRRILWAFWGILFLTALVSRAFPQAQSLLKLSTRELAGSSRVLLSSSEPLSFSFRKEPSVLVVAVEAKHALRVRQDVFKSGWLKSVSWTGDRNSYEFSIEVREKDFAYDYTIRENPFELVIDLKPVAVDPEPAPAVLTAAIETKAAANRTPVPAAAIPAVSREASSQEDRRFRTIVIDPGHGGIETGAKGKFGALEKDITLAMSLKLKEIIEKNMAFRVILTRDRDTEVALENRSALANNNKADLFISIHANGSRRKNARGSETYFLSLNATDEESRRLAYLENANGDLEGRIEKENEDDVTLILWDLAQAAYLKQSSRLADRIQAGLNDLLGTRNRGVKQAPFKVLTGAACPAVLVEAAFISNPEEEKELQSEEFQNNVARAIYQSLVAYFQLGS